MEPQRRLEVCDRITGLATGILCDFPEDRRAAAILYVLAGAVAIGDEWFDRLDAVVMDHARAFAAFHACNEVQS